MRDAYGPIPGASVLLQVSLLQCQQAHRDAVWCQVQSLQPSSFWQEKMVVLPEEYSLSILLCCLCVKVSE